MSAPDTGSLSIFDRTMAAVATVVSYDQGEEDDPCVIILNFVVL